MIKTTFKKIFPTLLITYTACYLGLFIFFQILPPKIVLPSFQLKYAFDVTFLHFIKFLIPINCTGLMIAYSFVLNQDDMISIKGTTQLFHKVVTPILVILFIFTVIYTLFITWSYSLTWRSITGMETNSKVFDSYFNKAEEVNKTGEHEKALKFLEACLLIDDKSGRAKELKVEIERFMLRNNIPVEVQETVSSQDYPDEGMKIGDVVNKAKDFYYKRDWFSAYYYATLAFNMDPSRLDAETIASDAYKRIKAIESGIDGEDREDENPLLKLHKRKLAAHNALIVQRDYLTAYFAFKNLKAEIPGDVDIDKYLAMALEKLDQTSFFIEDVEIPLSLPGVNNFFFLNRDTEREKKEKNKEENEREKKPDFKEFVYIEKMVHYDDKIYFKNIEVIRINVFGKLLFHYKAPYGKYFYADVSWEDVEEGAIKENYINLNCVSRDNEEGAFPAQYIYGENEEPSKFLILSPELSQLPGISGDKEKYTDIGIVDLFEVKKYIKKLGYSSREVDIEIVTRLLFPFMFLILSLFSISAAWYYRSRYEKRVPIVTLLTLPLVPVLLTVFVNLILFISRIFYIFCLMAFDYTSTLLLGGIIMFVFLTIAIVFLAGQITDK